MAGVAAAAAAASVVVRNKNKKAEEPEEKVCSLFDWKNGAFFRKMRSQRVGLFDEMES